MLDRFATSEDAPLSWRMGPAFMQLPTKQIRSILSILLGFVGPAIAADPTAELASFSVFDKVNLAELAKSDAKTVHGPPMNGRYLSVQSCYVVPGSPARQMEALRKWNPQNHRELKIFLHGDLPSTPSATNFSKLTSAPTNGPVNALVSATLKMSRDLQISNEEAKNGPPSDKGGGGSMPSGVVAYWSNLLAARAKLFVSGGSASQPPYDHPGRNISPNEELKSLLKQQDKIRRQFSDFLGATGIGRGSGSMTPELFWELADIDDQGALTLGASYQRSESNQTADAVYYASGGYYAGITLHQMWPVTVEGKPCTLVWRGDMISSAALESLHGVERLASEGAMVKDIAKAVSLFRRDTSGNR